MKDLAILTFYFRIITLTIFVNLMFVLPIVLICSVGNYFRLNVLKSLVTY